MMTANVDTKNLLTNGTFGKPAAIQSPPNLLNLTRQQALKYQWHLSDHLTSKKYCLLLNQIETKIIYSNNLINNLHILVSNIISNGKRTYKITLPSPSTGLLDDDAPLTLII